MKRIIILIIIFLIFSGVSDYPGIGNTTRASIAENAITMQIWPKSALSDNAGPETERNMPSRGDGVIRITDITAPSITISLFSWVKKRTKYTKTRSMNGGAILRAFVQSTTSKAITSL